MTRSWKDATSLLENLVPWFQAVARTLPWRAKDLSLPHPDPYAVLVSELMLQQTQVATVVPYFERWMQRFPTVESLAQADATELHKLWEGLGYYRRARYLQAAAKTISEGAWPKDLNGLAALPGLGPYTAAALASIAFQQPEAALDGNAFRVLARLLCLREDPKSFAAQLRTWLRPALQAHGPSLLTQGLMELGATVCTPKPRCASCPLAAACCAHLEKQTDSIPAPRKRPEVRRVEILLLAIHGDGHWLLEKPTTKGLLAGLWRWPLREAQETLQNLAAETCQPYRALDPQTWPVWVQVYSHRREHVLPLRIDLQLRYAIPGNMAWVPNSELQALPMGKRDQRLREILNSPGRAYQGSLPALPGHQG